MKSIFKMLVEHSQKPTQPATGQIHVTFNQESAGLHGHYALEPYGQLPGYTSTEPDGTIFPQMGG